MPNPWMNGTKQNIKGSAQGGQGAWYEPNSPSAQPKPVQANNLGVKGYQENWYEQNQKKIGARTEAEKYYDQTKGSYAGESEAGKYWQGVAGKYNQGGPGYAKDAYQQALGTSQDLNGYYDHAFSVGQDRVNRAAASRGMFGSSGAMRGVSDLSASLGAEQANREGQYGLDRAGMIGNLAGQASADERGWASTMGGLAAQADAGDIARLGAGGIAANSADAGRYGRLGAGMEASASAQNAKEGRVGGLYDRAFGQDAAYAGIASGANNQALDDKHNYIDAATAYELGIPEEGLRTLAQGRENAYRDLNTVAGIWSGAKQTFGKRADDPKDPGTKK